MVVGQAGGAARTPMSSEKTWCTFGHCRLSHTPWVWRMWTQPEGRRVSCGQLHWYHSSDSVSKVGIPRKYRHVGLL